MKDLTVKRTLYTVGNYCKGSNFGRFRSRNTWQSKKYLAYTKYYPMGTKFGPFRSTTNRFQDIRLSNIRKTRNAPNNLRLTINT